MTQIFINPGSGPVDLGTVEQSYANIKALIADVVARATYVGEVTYAYMGEGRSGRHRWKVIFAGVPSYDIDMPALPLERVRYLGKESGSPFDYPRLYVEGDSWLWKHAVNVIVGGLTDPDAWRQA